MLSIGEFSNICKVSTKTLRYYAEIGLLEPSEVNPENGYRYYAIEQLEKMLFINRLKAYSFSLDKIKTILQSEEIQDDTLYLAFIQKKKEIEKQVHSYRQLLAQLEDDISAIEQEKSIMSYMDEIDVRLVDVPKMKHSAARLQKEKTSYKQLNCNIYGGMPLSREDWVLCPTCNCKTRIKIRDDTILENFLLYCPKCKQETLINVNPFLQLPLSKYFKWG